MKIRYGTFAPSRKTRSRTRSKNGKKRWQRGIKSGEGYFEGDKFDEVVSKAINFKKCSVSLWTALILSSHSKHLVMCTDNAFYYIGEIRFKKGSALSVCV